MGEDQTAAPTLAEFIRSQRESILRVWEERVRQLSPASKLSHKDLRDHLPHVLERIAELAEHAGAHGHLAAEEAEQHAVDRLQSGYDLSDVVREYSLLREILLDAAAEAEVPGVRDLRLLNRVLDHATQVAVARFAQASQRVLKALDRISREALHAQSDLPQLLERLLRVMMEACPAVDAATILLREGELLYVRAALGLMDDREPSRPLAIGEGFAGAIAQDRQPRLVRNASEDPLIRKEFVQHSGVRAIYGVPLLDGEVVGVAHMGSRTAYEFSDEDQLLLRAMANRAAAFIVEARLREDVERRAAELEAVLESIPDGVYVGDAAGLQRVNRRGREMLGLSADRPLDEPLDALSREIDVRSAATGERVPIEEQAYWRALRGETVDTEVRIRRSSDGQERYLRSVAAPIHLRGAIVGAVAVNSDITERKSFEEQRRNEAEYRERFMGILGHDLRTPVTAIGMAAQLLLQQESITDRATRMLRRILSSTARIEAMISDLLDFTRARSGSGVPLKRARTDLASCVRQVVDELALAHPDRDIDVTVDGDARGVWDAERLAQLVSNLVSNAIHYSPHDSRVAVGVRSDADDVVLEVSNPGEPIAESLLPHLFDPFRRGDLIDEGRTAGLGLGLFITRSIVTAHGGQIAVSSTTAGTTFTVRLPRAPGA